MTNAARLQALLDRRATAVEGLRGHLDSIGAEPTAEDRSKTEAYDTELLELDREVRRVNGLIDGERAAEEARSALATATSREGGRREERVSDDDILRQIASGELRSHTFSTEQRAETTGDHPALTDAPTFLTQLIQQLYEVSSVYRLNPFIIRTPDAREVKVPRAALGGKAQRVSEGQSRRTGRARATTDSVTLRAFEYGDIWVATKQLLRDSLVPIAPLIAADQAWAIATAMADDLYLGTGGANDPEGVLTSFASTPAAAHDAISLEDVIDLQHAVAVPYRAGARFVVGDLTVAALRKLREGTDGEGAFLWRDPMDGDGLPTLMGKPVVIEPVVAAPGPEAVSMAFGDFNRGYILREVGAVEVSQSSDAYFEVSSVGVKVEMALDGRVRDPNAVRVLAHPDTP